MSQVSSLLPEYSLIFDTLFPKTENLRGFVVSLFCPNTSKVKIRKIVTIVVPLFLDLMTLPLRLTTAVPKFIFDRWRRSISYSIPFPRKPTEPTKPLNQQSSSAENSGLDDNEEDEFLSAKSSEENFEGDLFFECTNLQTIATCFAPLRYKIGNESPALLSFFDIILPLAFKEESIESVVENGDSFTINFKERFSVQGKINKTIHGFKKEIDFEIGMPKELKVTHLKEHQLKFDPPIDFDVRGCFISTQSKVKELQFKFNSQNDREDIVYMEYNSSQYSSKLHYDELLSIKLASPRF